MKRIIDQEAAKVVTVEVPTDSHKETEAFNQVFTETLEHAHQCVAKVERFHGREGTVSVTAASFICIIRIHLFHIIWRGQSIFKLCRAAVSQLVACWASDLQVEQSILCLGCDS
jgi:hypothetical protein